MHDLPEDAAMQAFRALAPLSALTAAAARELFDHCHVHAFPPPAELAREGKITDSAVIIVDGAVEMTARLGNRETILAIRHGPAALNVCAALEGAPALATTLVLRPVRALFLPATALRPAVAANPAFAKAILALCLQEQQAALAALKSQKLRDGPQRLAEWLLAVSSGARGTFDLPYDKTRVARLLGMTPENLARTFGTLAGHGVRLLKARVTITDAEKLGRFAGLGGHDTG